MRTHDKTVNDLEKSKLLEEPDRSPKRSFFTPWLKSNLGFFRVYITVIGPVSKKPEDYSPLSYRKAKRILKAITNIIVLLTKKAR